MINARFSNQLSIDLLTLKNHVLFTCKQHSLYFIILQHFVPTCFSATLICCGMLPASEEVFEEEEVRENPSSPRRKLLWLRRRLSSLQDLQITYRSVNGGAIYRLKKLTEIFKRHYLEESQRQPNTHTAPFGTIFPVCCSPQRFLT